MRSKRDRDDGEIGSHSPNEIIYCSKTIWKIGGSCQKKLRRVPPAWAFVGLGATLPRKEGSNEIDRKAGETSLLWSGILDRSTQD